MSRALAVLSLHLFLLFSMLGSALSSPLMALYSPDFFRQVYIPTYAILAGLTMVGWNKRFGGCFLTTLENRYRALENRPTYTETFIVHYIRVATGLEAPKNAVTVVLVSIMLLPVATFAAWQLK